MRLGHVRNINGVVNTYKGRSFILYNDVYIAEIDQCKLEAFNFRYITDIFPDFPTRFNGVFRYIDGLLYVFHDNSIYIYNEFTNMIEKTITKSLSLFDITCPQETLLQQLKKLVSQISSSNIRIPINY